ncbi:MULTISPECIES: acetylornithine transaminase [Streptomyces]|uniref:Acetylornithine aminotransferase n=1 Tax=Streptomyces tsukubensis (strain DSM 42081 / NBRC 108919 / NRRL 18488 / 9993) TaxID=1114943 RepID=I2MVH1_STRT9|nr:MULTISPECIES: acetylornithine transaminase [Streptomyces]AZK93233.1 aspartate aminotransferase family protein [Streptomyces tsukubensis]EIF88768.1 acetylornithine aminotransferase [Streptomyces tsukubensis NRRL18488]MYS67700.1 acetylornithine transaminase [Streptomyces sp. SID5473]QKM70608.1 acetylornithine transaminase [Streptomyces tsukubensis NRRL18488]TAI41298.1 acetylornithine transaminase [Streptomyces tsukubensis]
MTTNHENVQRWRDVMADNYGTPGLALTHGEGATVHDADGTAYLDFVGGIAVNALGHGHPAVVEAVTRQISALGHISNLFIAEPPVTLAERLIQLSGRPGRVFFCNSGAEANEAAFKIGRLTGRRHMVATHGGFHGRTMGALALTGQPAKQQPFLPLPGDVTHVPYGDAEALRDAVTEDTALVIIEPIQGENGVVTPPKGYLTAARDITRATGTLLVLDEVQTGIGRTGHWFAAQAEGVEADIVTLAKALGGGLPLGATLAFGPAADLLKPGQHGTTFGGNPVACAAGLAVLDTIAAEGLLDEVKRLGEKIRSGVESLNHPQVSHVRGAGLLLGIVLKEPLAPQVQKAAQGAGFLVNAPAPDVVRLMPPLTIGEEAVDALLQALPGILDQAEGQNGE